MLDTVITDPPTLIHDGAYIVDYDEDQWKRYTAETQEYCKATWKKRAAAQGCERIALRLIPDPIFPCYGKEKPYFVWQEDLLSRSKVQALYTFAAEVVVTLAHDLNRKQMQELMHTLSRSYPRGSRYRIEHPEYGLQSKGVL